ncbi:unnamed protein product, partial [Mesorhabditis spiculigera]
MGPATQCTIPPRNVRPEQVAFGELINGTTVFYVARVNGADPVALYPASGALISLAQQYRDAERDDVRGPKIDRSCGSTMFPMVRPAGMKMAAEVAHSSADSPSSWASLLHLLLLAVAILLQ